MADTPYSPYYAQNIEQSSAPVASGKQFVQEDVDRQEAIKRQIGSAAEKYANQTGVGISDAKALMQARYDNMIASEKAKVALETRDLQAQSALSRAQIELSKVNHSDEKAIDKYSDIASRFSTDLAGTKYFNDFNNQLKSLQGDAIRVQNELLKSRKETRIAEQAQITEGLKAETEARKAKTEEDRYNPQKIEERAAAAARGKASVVAPANQIKALKDQRNSLIPKGLNEADLFYPAFDVDASGKKVDPSSKNATHFMFAVKDTSKKPIIKSKAEIKDAQQKVSAINARIEQLERGFGKVDEAVNKEPEDTSSVLPQSPTEDTSGRKPLSSFETQ